LIWGGSQLQEETNHTVRTLKPQLQKTLRRLGLYHRLQASQLYDFYWRIADRSLVERRCKEVDFYRKLLSGFSPGDLIFDVGANHGAKTDVFLRLGAQVVAIEPDNTNQQILREKFLRYRLTRKPVVIVGKAVSEKNSVDTMWVDEPGSAKNTLSQKWVETLRGDEGRFGHRLKFGQWTEVETTTLEQLITTQGLPFFVKIDVEGHELNVLRGLHRPVPYLSFEVNLPEFRSEGLACIERLAGLACKGEFNYASDCQQGLLLDRWLRPQEFSCVLEKCAEKSVEVFWKTSVST
jgi:FkbM family methyltransferase